MITATATAKDVEHIMTIYEMLKTYRVYCRSFFGRGWVAWAWVHGKRVEAEAKGGSAFNAVENLRDKIESASVLEVMHG